jgi:chromosome segregation ATPase
MILENYLGEIITGIGAALTTLTGYLVGKRRSNAETKQVEAEALKASQEVYDTLVGHTKQFVKDTEERNTILKKQVDLLSTNLEKINVNFEALEKEVDHLRKTIEILEKELHECKEINQKNNIKTTLHIKPKRASKTNVKDVPKV